MKLLRGTDGTITLDGLPIREWFKGYNIRPTQDRYRDGVREMCLLTSAAYAELGYDPDALYCRFEEIHPRNEGETPKFRRASDMLASVIGITPREARDLEAGWVNDSLELAVAEARGRPTELILLGADAWKQARGEP
jgi:hypothetical protein